MSSLIVSILHILCIILEDVFFFYNFLLKFHSYCTNGLPPCWFTLKQIILSLKPFHVSCNIVDASTYNHGKLEDCLSWDLEILLAACSQFSHLLAPLPPAKVLCNLIRDSLVKCFSFSIILMKFLRISTMFQNFWMGVSSVLRILVVWTDSVFFRCISSIFQNVPSSSPTNNLQQYCSMSRILT